MFPTQRRSKERGMSPEDSAMAPTWQHRGPCPSQPAGNVCVFMYNVYIYLLPRASLVCSPWAAWRLPDLPIHTSARQERLCPRGKGEGRIACTGHAPQTITVWWKALREIGYWSWPHLLIKWALQIGFKSRRGAVEHWECSQSLYGTLQDPFQLLCQRWIHDEITSASTIVSAIYSGFQQCSDLRGEDFANLNKLITDSYLKLTEIHVWENQTGTGLECGRQSELHIAEP